MAHIFYILKEEDETRNKSILDFKDSPLLQQVKSLAVGLKKRHASVKERLEQSSEIR